MLSVKDSMSNGDTFFVIIVVEEKKNNVALN